MQSDIANRLPLEREVEDVANSRTGLLKNFRVAPCEYKRFTLFGIMFGIIGFIYSFMRILKDNYVMSRQEPICILYIKLFYIAPLSFMVVFGINYLLIRRPVSKLFSLFSLAFMSLFFLLGTMVIFERPLSVTTSFMGTRLAAFAKSVDNIGFLKYFILTLVEPLATAVYIVAELWGSLILSYLFLSYMNETCTESQHSRFIPPLFIIANLSLLASAMVTTLFFKIKEHLTEEQNVLFMGFIFFLEGFLVLCMLFCKYILETKVITKPIFISEKVREPKAPKATPGFAESLGTMRDSKFLMAMCTVVCFYSVVFNILETVYKNGIKRGAIAMGEEPGKYSGKFNSYDQYVTSISVILLNLSTFSKWVDKRGWLVVALITPMIGLLSTICILGLGSYNAAADDSSIGIFNAMFGGAATFIVLENYLGTFCLAAMKIFKYTAFDVTKERISMRIEGRYRPKFKSIYDGIFNKFGKSLGATYGILLSSITTDIDFRGFSPISSALMTGFLGIWIFYVFYLGRSFNASVKADQPIDIDLSSKASEEDPNKPQSEEQDLKAYLSENKDLKKQVIDSTELKNTAPEARDTARAQDGRLPDPQDLKKDL